MKKRSTRRCTDTAAALGFISAIGAIGALLYSESLRHLVGDDRLTGWRDESLFVFYVVCVLVTRWSTAAVNPLNHNDLSAG